jgi:hypothetical protein
LGEVVKLGRLLVRTGFVASGFAASFVLLGLSLPRHARAFSEPRTYAADPVAGGGGNRWFTGSPAEGYSCSDCHTGGMGARLYVEGLPDKTYVPGAVYDVRLSWPEFASEYTTRYQQLKAAPVPGVNPPSMGVLAEIVADSGQGGGTIEIADNSDAMPGERCISGRLGTDLYSVKPGLKTVKAQRKCQAGALGERCVLAARACGPQELRFRWTAPPVSQGAIWFAAGFVTTAQFSGNPQGDGVTETTRVLLPAGEGKYESVLRSEGCSASGALGGGAVEGGVACSALAGALLVSCALRMRAARRSVRAVTS